MQIVLGIGTALCSCRASEGIDRESGPMSLGQTLTRFLNSLQGDLFPWLEEELGPLGERYRRFVTVLEFARVESFLPHFHGLPGRPVEDRAALARAFIAKAVFDVPTTRALIERLEVDKTLRRLCGLELCRRSAERGDLFTGLRRVLRECTARTPARGADQADPRRPPGGACLARFDGGRGAREASAQTQEGEAEAQARSPAQG